MCTGGEYREYRGVRHDRHFSAASSFHNGVLPGHCAIVGDGWAGQP
jgi:hypothetical protein